MSLAQVLELVRFQTGLIGELKAEIQALRADVNELREQGAMGRSIG